MAGRHLLRALVGELGRRSEAAGMIDQRIAETDPQLWIAGIFLHGILQDADGVFTLAIAFQSLGHAQPAFSRREIAEESVTGVCEWKDVMTLPRRGAGARQ